MKAKIHELKTWPEYFAVAGDDKRFELRKDDRGFEVGDFLLLKEFDPSTNEYTGKKKIMVVDSIFRNIPKFGLMDGYCIMSVTKVDIQ
jgi:hypothetical protein